MVEVKIGNMFESTATTLVNTVNCAGVMGKGVALEFKKRYPDMYKDYAAMCADNLVKPGCPYVYQDLIGTSILNFPTKDHWRAASKLSYVIQGLDWFVANYEKFGIRTIAFPPLGCGNGGLKWSVVGPIMYDKLKDLPIDVEIYAPYGTSADMMSIGYLEGNLRYPSNDIKGSTGVKFNKYWLLIVYVIQELNHDKYSLNVGRTIFQKICYILTRTGIPTGLHFVENYHGPYAPEVKNVMNILANANYMTEQACGKMVKTVVSSDFKLPVDMFTPDELGKAEKTYDLMSRVHSTDQAEMLATVLFTYDELATKGTVSMSSMLDHIFKWKRHWYPGKTEEIINTMYDLASLDWMKPIADVEPVDF